MCQHIDKNKPAQNDIILKSFISHEFHINIDNI